MKDGLLEHLKIGMQIIKQGKLITQQEHLLHFKQDYPITIQERQQHIKEEILLTTRYLHNDN